MKLADKFTFSRIVLSPIFFILYYVPYRTGFCVELSVCALIPLFIIIEITDFFDGYFARKRGEVSDFGKLFDPFADVLTHLTVFLAFLLSGYMPVAAYLIIIFREYTILFIRMLALRLGTAMGARKSGKTKTVVYVVSASYSLFIECMRRLNVGNGLFERQDFITAGYVLYGIAVLLSLASLFDYCAQFRKLSAAANSGGKA